MRKLSWSNKKCVVCGEVIIRKPTYSQKMWKTAKYCSKKCWSVRGKIVKKKCENCGNEFSLPAHLMKLGQKREKRGCSRVCSYALTSAQNSYMWKGVRAKYERFRDALGNTNLYRNWKKDIKIRDGNRCVNCGKSEKHLHVHHIYPLAKIIEDEGWSMDRWTELYHSPNSRLWDRKNGVTICSDCHYSLISYALQSKGFSPK